MESASVVGIYLHPRKAAPMQPVESAQADAGRGLVGDVYYQGPESRPPKTGEDREITLIESEAIEAAASESGIPLSHEESRRNVVTRGIALNPLVGREFRVGETLLRGLRLCHPCNHLESLTRPGVLKALENRGGLRAQVLEGGTIRVGDAVRL